MRPSRISFLVARIRAEHMCRELMQLAFVLTVVVLLAGQAAALGADIFRTAPASGSAGAGGATATGSGGTAAAPLGSTIDTAVLLQQRALASINRTDTAIRAVNAAQQAARAAAAAAASSVPNGLQAGGLEPLDLSAMDKWKGALAPTTAAGKSNDVTIVQNEQNALLTWKTFNIGKDTTLSFDQSKGGASAGQWIAFNHVQDPSAKPSQILGILQTIGAGATDALGNRPVGGQVYVINPNGIIFGGASQVNVHALVASSLPINERLVAQGLLANPNNEFLFAATELDRKGRGVLERIYGDITVEPGAQLLAPTNADHNGGRVALFGANVTNAGTISTPDGQTILAAGLQIGLDAHDPNDPTVRGLDIFVGVAAPGAGVARNSGLIEVHRGNATMTGRTVDQLGAIDATTSVSYNGSIILDASYGAKSNYNEREQAPAPPEMTKFVPTQTGTVTLGAGSATRVRPEWESTEKVVGSALALASKINLRGLNIHLGADAALWAPGAVLSLDAGRWLAYDVDLGIPPGVQFIYEDAPGGPAAPRTGGQIYLDSGSLIDVSGTTAVQASVSDNVIKVELRGAEFANSPVQRDSELRGETVYVDIRKTGKREDGTTWIGTPLADVTGYANLIQRSIGQLTTKGGSVAMNAGGAVVIQDGATVDVSGGYTNYTAGEVRTTKIIDGNRIIDISKATADRSYDGIYRETTTTTDPKWGTTKTSGGSVSESFFEAGYTEGAAGGSFAITAPVMALDGTLRGQTVAGQRQRSQLPEAGKLELNLRSQLVVGGVDSSPALFGHAATPPDIVFRNATSLPAVGDFTLDADGHARALSPERVATLELAIALFGAEGFGTLAVENTQGDITLSQGATLAGTAGGQLTLSGANVSILGTVRAPGGRLSFKAFNYSPLDDLWINDTGLSIANMFTPAPDRGVVSLGGGSKLDTAGLLVDERTESGLALPLATKGGTVALEGYSVELAAGSVVDVSGGVVRSPTGKLSYGSGGAIQLAGGQDVGATNVVGGRLVVTGGLSGYSGTTGGQLSLKASSIQVGGTTDRLTTLLLQPQYFSTGGFSSFALTGIGEWTDTPLNFVPGLLIAPNTVIAPKQQNRFAVEGPTSLAWADPITLADEAFRTPISLAFTASGLSRQTSSADPRVDSFGLLLRGDLLVGEGVVIKTDPKGSVAFAGQLVEIDQGVQVSAPGGNIAVRGATDSSWLFGDWGRSVARPTVVLAEGSKLSTQGMVVKQPKDARRYEAGTVLAGGSISVAGNIVGEQGATLDVSGASGTVDRLPGYSGQAGSGDSLLSAPELVPTVESSNGGSITLAGSALLVSDATLLGGAGGPSARGGEVVVSSGQFIAPNDLVSLADALDVTLRVRQQAVEAGVVDRFIGTYDTESALPIGGGFVTADRLQSGGFDRIDLRGTVSFEGPVSLAAKGSLAVGDGGVLYTDSAVELSAPYVRLGQPFWEPQLPGVRNPHVQEIRNGVLFYYPPSNGQGTLTVKATELIDAGDLSLQNTGRLNLLVGSGEIRGNGTVDVAGSITLQAGQIYPTTAGEFTIAAHDYSVDTEIVAEDPEVLPGTITVLPGENRGLPLSAGGTLNLFAGHIFQEGTLRAPIGTINLGWDGTGTAPKGNLTNIAQPVARLTNLGTGSTTSVSAVDPTTGKDLTVPYGGILNGISWIDPRGIDITTGGLPEKRVNVSAQTIEHEAGATIDLRGGGDLYAYRWVSGNGGRTDVLASTTSFAVIPAYNAEFAPYAPFSPQASVVLGTELQPDRGYVNGSLKAGDRIHLEASAALPSGEYTLLPARYALLPGAVLVTPKSGLPPDTALVSPEGASLVSGYRFNSLDRTRTDAPLRVAYEVAPQKVVEARAQYDDYSANTFFTEKAAARDVEAPRLPVDAGQLVLAATERMQLRGLVSAQGAAKGRNGLVDLSAPGEILIAGNAAATSENALVLSAADLSTFKAESLLIGGIRRSTDEGTAVTVTADSVTLDNAGTPLTGSDIVLVANEAIELAAGSELRSSGALADTDPLLLGDAEVAGSGNGVLVRVSADAQARSVRQGIAVPVATEVEGTGEVVPAVTPRLEVGAGVVLAGASGTLDSSHATQLDSTARLGTDSLALSSGRIGLVLDEAGEVDADGSLLLAGGALDTLQEAAGTLSLQGYSSIDLFGHGQVGAVDAGGRPVVTGLEMHTAEIRGFNTGEGRVILAARDVRLDNVARGVAGPSGTTGQGTLAVIADTLRLGAGELAENGTVAVNGFAAVEVDAATAIVGTEVGGLRVAGDLALRTPLLTASTAADLAIVATGDLEVGSAGATGYTTEVGLGARIALTGAQVTTAGTIRLPSGRLSVRATAGNLEVGGRIDVAGTAKTFIDVVKYTDAGDVSLRSDTGSVMLAEHAVISVAAAAGGGDAGTLNVAAPNGVLELPMQPSGALTAEVGEAPEPTVVPGVLLGRAGKEGLGGTFNLDVGATTTESFASLQAALNDGGFSESRSVRVRTGDVAVAGAITAHSVKIAVDGGNLTVAGEIDASGIRGGEIDLLASGSVVLEDGAELTVAAQEYDAAGKGGRVSLEAGSYVDGVSNPEAEVAIRSGSTIDLSVAAEAATMEDIDGNPIDLGQRSGTLHLRAPQIGEGAEVQVAQIGGTITGASSVVVEAYKVFDLNPANQAGSKAITTTTENAVRANGLALGNNTEEITARLLANNAGLAEVFHLQPGAEVVNRNGDLTLNHAWNFSGYRFGPTADAAIAGSGEPGTLTLRTSGDLLFDTLYTASTKKWTLGSLNDGFTGGLAARGGLVDQVLLPVGSRSWSYRLVAGADFGAADFRAVADSAGAKGSIVIGSGSLALPTSGTNNSRYAITGSNNMIPARFQTIRTGTGDIELVAAYDVRLLNNVATIYTAGQQVAELAGFDVPSLGYYAVLAQAKYGHNQFPSRVQYSTAGGNVSVEAGHDIAHLAETKVNGKTVLVPDSSKELPSNWLYRRGLVDPETGLFVVREDTVAGEAMSTTWWIDYSNFYEGVATLGGGNVRLVAGNNILNVDAAVATNARMPGRDGAGDAVQPDASALVELGGGDLTVRAGGDLDGGVYYVERGRGALVAGGEIRTNQTRSTVLPSDAPTQGMQESTWLPTTLFLGKGSFDLAAGGDLLLGPVANPFLLPSGTNNGSYNRTYFSTAAPSNELRLSSITGDIVLRNGSVSSRGDLSAWFNNVLVYSTSPGSSPYAMTLPWLRLSQISTIFGDSVNVFKTAAGLMPAQLRATAFGGDIAINGRLNLMPSALGHLELAAAGSVDGFQYVNDTNTQLREWASSSVNLSDADPSRFPGVTTPLGGAGPAPTNREYVGVDADFMRAFDSLLNETGSDRGSLQDKQALHAPELLHSGSNEPVRIYALDGDITGLTLYSPKATKVVAGHDITDVSLYLQNINPNDISVVSAGRDIVAFNPNSAARTRAQQAGNQLLENASSASTPGPASGAPTAGDIQISGPGTIEVLAGRNLDLGIGPNVGDGTGLGLTSIGNTRNPALGEDGAAIIALAGLGYKWALQGDQAEFTTAIDALLNPTKTGSPAARFLPVLGELMGLDSSANEAVWSAFSALPEADQRRFADVLMDTAHLGAANGLAGSALNFDAFTTAFLDPSTAGAQAARYLPAVGTKLGLAATGVQEIWTAYAALPEERQAQLALGVFFSVLRDAGRDYNNPDSPVFRDKKYPNGYAAIAKLFPGHLWEGDIALTSREIKTFNGGEIGLFAPGGGLTVGFDVSGTQPLDQGILTERGGGISIFTHGSVIVGTSRIFTLRGGDEIIWSSTGDIAAGSSSKTVQSAPPTRVLIDPTSGDVKTDLAGLATGGGIGVLATVKGVKPGDIDLIAPTGAIDAGDAGIRSSGNLNIAALTIVNAANIATGGSSAGVPATTTPSLGGVAAAASSSTAGTSKTAVAADTSTGTREVMRTQDLPSLIQVEVLGYGGGDKTDEDEPDDETNAAQGVSGADQAAASPAPQA